MKTVTKLIPALLALLFQYPAQAFYNPSTGRWINRDPIGEDGGANLSGFAYNNPASLIDGRGDDPQESDPEVETIILGARELPGLITPGPCGEYKWVIEWAVTRTGGDPRVKPRGFVVQRLTFSWDITKRKGRDSFEDGGIVGFPGLEGPRGTVSYTEAWEVTGFTGGSGVFNSDDGRKDTFHSPTQGASFGWMNWDGSAYFSKSNEPQNWSRTEVPMSGSLRAVKGTESVGRDSKNTVIHQLKTEWDCCVPEKDSEDKIHRQTKGTRVFKDK